MMNFGYNNRCVRLIKDVLFLALAVWAVSTGRFLAIALGLLFGWWYARDAWFQAKALWQEKHFVPKSERTTEGPTTTQPQDDGKITITDLSDAKEVNFEKE